MSGGGGGSNGINGGNSSFGGGGTQQLGGVKKTSDFLDKSTWFLATALIVLILASNLMMETGGQVESKALDTTEDTSTLPPLNTIPNDEDTSSD